MYLIAWMLDINDIYKYILVYITNIYLFILYNSFITDIENSPNYRAFVLRQTHQVR